MFFIGISVLNMCYHPCVLSSTCICCVCVWFIYYLCEMLFFFPRVIPANMNISWLLVYSFYFYFISSELCVSGETKGIATPHFVLFVLYTTFIHTDLHIMNEWNIYFTLYLHCVLFISTRAWGFFWVFLLLFIVYCLFFFLTQSCQQQHKRWYKNKSQTCMEKTRVFTYLNYHFLVQYTHTSRRYSFFSHFALLYTLLFKTYTSTSFHFFFSFFHIWYLTFLLSFFAYQINSEFAQTYRRFRLCTINIMGRPNQIKCPVSNYRHVYHKRMST